MVKINSKFGTILKRETLASAKLDIVKQPLILHSNDPFPGYYCSEVAPTDNSCKEISYYLPIKEQEYNDIEKYCRISLDMQKLVNVMICPARFNYEDRSTHAFRIKGVKEEELSDILKLLADKGVQFFPEKKVKSFLSHIHLKAFFELDQISENIYKNSDSEGLFYFDIPAQLSWEEFEQIITYQKSNSKFRNFDAAIGYWIERPEFVDFMRIYGNDLDEETLEGIRRDFIKNYKSYSKAGMLL